MQLKRHWFQYISHGILVLFFGIMAIVIGIAFSRHSGSTGLDMSTIQKVRFDKFSGLPPALPMKTP